MAPYLCYFFHAHLSFRFPELNAIATLFGIKITPLHDIPEDSPFLMIDVEGEEQLKLLASRAILVKGFYEVWARGTTYEELLESLTKYPQAEIDKYTSEGNTFKMKVRGFGRSFSVQQQREIMKLFEPTALFKAKVNLKNPINKFQVVEDVGQHLPENTPPKQIFLLRTIVKGQKKLVDRYSLKKRKYLGTTSMDAKLSLIQANLALAKPGSFVYDPFVGTGSILVACSHFGAFSSGSDINPMTLRGKVKDCNVKANFLQYQLSGRLIDLFVHDHSLPLWRPIPLFDAIVSDPPYGIREGARKVGRNPEKEAYEISEEMRASHISSCVQYNQSDISNELILFAAKMLKVGGRLVFWFPAITASYSDDDIPKHDCLEIVSNCVQILNHRISRRLITMSKIKDFDAAIHQSHLSVSSGAHDKIWNVRFNQ